MAKVIKNTYQDNQVGGTTPWGNTSNLVFELETTTKGFLVGTSYNKALAANDVVVLGELPEGYRLDDASLIVEKALKTATTGKVGFAYQDGVDHTTIKQDDAYFGSALNLAAVGKLRATNTKLVRLPKPAYLIVTLSGAAQDAAGKVSVIVTGELMGAN